MWVCPNCETANNSQKRKCAVCDSEKPFSNENPNSPSILKSKIQELEEQILILKEEQISLNQSKETLSSELSRVKYALNTSNSEKDNLKKQLEKITSEKTSIDNKLKQIEKDKTSLLTSLTTTKAELETKVINLQAEVEKLKQDDNTGYLGIIIVILFIGLIVSLVTRSTKKSNNNDLFLEQLRETTQMPFIFKTIDIKNAKNNQIGNSFKSNELTYATPIINAICLYDTTLVLQVKFIRPNGNIKRNTDISPNNFSYNDTSRIKIGQQKIVITGWGNDSGGTYEVGTHTAEIWYNGKIIGKQTFTVSY